MASENQPSGEWLRRLALGSVQRWAVSQELAQRGYGPIRSLAEPRFAAFRRWVARHEFMVAILVLLALLALPINVCFLILGNASEASEWLRTLWQVEAAALALSLTIMVFALEIFGRSGVVRYGGTLNAFAERAGLARAFRLGVIALVIDGVVLAGLGHDAPAGWAAFVASLVSGAAIVSLPFVLNRVLRDTDTEHLREVRTTALREAVSATVRTQVIEMFALAEVQRLSTAHDFDLHLALPPDVLSGQVEISAAADGAVVDINMDRLVKLVNQVRSLGRISLRVRLGSPVAERSTLLVLPKGADRGAQAMAERVVRSAPRAPDLLGDHLDQLHDDALEAIRQRQPAAYEDIADAYTATLMEFPAAWRTYRQEYDAKIAAGIDIYPIGPVQQVQRALYEELTVAADGNREVMFTAAGLPMRVILRALEVNASGLVPSMLALYPQMYAIGASSPGEVAELLKERSWTHLSEIVRYGLRAKLESPIGSVRTQAVEDARQVFSRFGSLLRLAVDRGDTESLRKADEAWENSLRYFFPPAAPDAAEIEFLEAEAAQGEDVQEELDGARTAYAVGQAAGGLDTYKTAVRLSLAAWVWHRRARSQPSWAELFTYLAGRFGSVSDIAEATTVALAFEHESRHAGLLSDWIMSEQGEGVHSYAPEPPLFAAFAVLSLIRAAPDASPPQLDAAGWMDQYEDQVKGLVDVVAEDDGLAALGVQEGPQRAEPVKQAIAEAASAWREAEAEAVRGAPLYRPHAEEFESLALQALHDAHFVPRLLEYGGAVVEEHSAPPEPDELMLETYLPKELFIEGERMMGRDYTARDFGRNIAFRETQRFIAMLADTAQAGESAASVDAAVQEAVAAMESEGYSPSVALFPVNFRLLRQLGLPYNAQGIPLPSGLLLGEDARNGFRGFLDALAVFQDPDVPEDRIYVIDPGAFAEGHAWQVQRADKMWVREIDEAAAREIAARPPPPGPDETESSRVRDLMGRVRVTAVLDVSFDVSDLKAGRWVQVPAAFRGD